MLGPRVSLLLAGVLTVAACGGDVVAATSGETVSESGGSSSEVSSGGSETSSETTGDDDGLAPLPEVEPPDCGFMRQDLTPTIDSLQGAGDFDGDGHVDLVASEAMDWMSPVTLRVWLGDGAGGLAPSLGLELAPEVRPEPLFVVGDVDGDARDEFIYSAMDNLDRFVGVHALDAGSVTPGFRLPLELPWTFTRLQDTNGDGLADLSFGGWHSDPARLLLSDGSTFIESTSMMQPACYVQDGDWADVDENGEPDLLLVGGCNGIREDTWVLIYTQTNGTFAVRDDSPMTVPWDPVFVRAGQFDGEPGLDLVVESLDQQLPIVLHHGNGDGSFAQPVEVGELSFTFELRERVDLDADGLDDLIAQSSWGTVWLHNDGVDFEPCVVAPGERFRLLAALDDGAPPRVITYDDDWLFSVWRAD